MTARAQRVTVKGAACGLTEALKGTEEKVEGEEVERVRTEVKKEGNCAEEVQVHPHPAAPLVDLAHLSDIDGDDVRLDSWISQLG